MDQAHAFRSVGALAMVAALCLGQAPQSKPHTLKRVHDPRRVTYSIRIKTCRAQHHGQLPDGNCTPGSIDPSVTQADIGSTICKSGWTGKVRPPELQTEHAKFDVAYPAYRIRQSAVSELDHLVPLELGGSNDITNLWPEVGKQPNPKDKVENAPNRAVCEGRVTLAAAQLAIATDWLTAEARLGLATPKPSPSPTATRTTPPPAGPECTASASYNSKYRDYDIYVYSNQPNKPVTATASNGATQTYHTDSSGYADVYLYADTGDTVHVKAGAASCSTVA